MNKDILVPMLENLSNEERFSVLSWETLIKKLLSPKYVNSFLREQKNQLGPLERKMLKETINQFREFLIDESYSVLCQRILILHDNRMQDIFEKEIVNDYKQDQ